MHILYEPLFFDFRRIDCIRLYNTCITLKLPYTALYGFIRQSGNYWTIAAQAGKQTKAIFADFSAFCADTGKYPILALKRLYGQIMALYGKLCRFGILSDCFGLSCPAVRHCFRLSGCPVSAEVYVNIPTCPLEYYVNRSDPQENFWAWSICLARSGSGRISADGFGTL